MALFSNAPILINAGPEIVSTEKISSGTTIGVNKKVSVLTTAGNYALDNGSRDGHMKTIYNFSPSVSTVTGSFAKPGSESLQEDESITMVWQDGVWLVIQRT